MYRGKRQMPRRVAKKMAKEIARQGKAEIFSSEATPFPPPRTLQMPKKIQYAEKAAKIELKTPKMKKGFKKVSKRTNPGSFPVEYSARAHVHPEGERWVKTLNRQERDHAKIFTKKALKMR